MAFLSAFLTEFFTAASNRKLEGSDVILIIYYLYFYTENYLIQFYLMRKFFTKSGLLIFIFNTFIISKLYCQNNAAPYLEELNKTIQKSPQFDAEKLHVINTLKTALAKERNSDKFQDFLKLYDEFRVFNYDSAYAYASKMEAYAKQSKDSFRIPYSKIKLGFILLSSGMFKEVFDTLKTINLKHLNQNEKAEYYTLMARSYYDLADYDKDEFYAPFYDSVGNKYVDSSLLFYPENSFQYYYYKGLKNIRSGNIDTALQFLKEIINKPTLSPHEIAITASTLSDIYIRRGETDTAIKLLVRAAIADIRSSTKETSATLNLATLLFRQNDLKNASTYIEKAVNDALFYGARQRKVQLSAILPLIEAEKLNIVEKEKHLVLTYAVVVTFLLILLIVLAIIIYRQVNKLKAAKKIISDAHVHQQVINGKLLEANKIKEEYIGYFFSGNSEFFSRIERFKKLVEQKLLERKPDEVHFLVKQLNVRQEREELLKSFDRIFLNLFPDFIEKFNAFFKDEDKIKLKEGELLNTDLRIFALIRMGIHDNEKIARILEYSVNTINTYKTKIKNKSILPNEEFEHKVMEIEAT